jgi:chemosensory pili system protein ChpA (sensor histidine kinase/response regulator)
MRFHDVALLLAASTQESGDVELSRLTTAIAEFAAWLRQQPECTSPAMAVEVAGALVLVEDAIEQEGARNPTDETLFAAEVTAELERLANIRQTKLASDRPLAHQRWREHRIIAQVAGEIRINLDAVEAALEGFMQTADSTALPATLHRQLHQAGGAFQLLGEAAAAALAGALDGAIATAGATPSDLATLAHWLTVLQEFATSLMRGQPDHALLAGLLPAGTPCTPAPADATSEISTATPDASGVDALVAIFIEEAHEVLATLATTQPLLAAQPADREALTILRRGFHTLKGSGRMVNLDTLGEAAYAVEKVLNRHLDEHRPADPALLALIAEAQTLFETWVVCLEQGQATPAATTLLQHCSVAPTAEKVGADATADPPPHAAPNTVTVGEQVLSATLYGLYIEEAHSHVTTLQQELSGTAGVPSRALIRAAHTLAGISAGSGFPVVQALSHALENALVRHSLAHRAPEEAGRMLLARAVGALEGMVGAIAERRLPAAETALTQALETLQPTASTSIEKPAEVSPLAERRQSRPDDEVDPQLAALFLEEADEQLHQLDADLHAWRTTPTQADIGRRMARLLHTFKGGARMCGAMGIGELAHSMETRIEQALAAGGARPGDLDGLDTSLERAHRLVDALRQPAVIPPPPVLPTVQPTPIAELQPPKTATAESGPAVLLRVRADLIDHLVNEAGEMAIARSRIEGSLKSFKGGLLDLADNVVRLRSQLREFELIAETSMQSQHGISEAHRFDPLELDRFTRLQELTRMMAESVNDVATVQHGLLRQTDAAGEALSAQSRQNRELSHALLRARMVPFSTVVDRLHRIVRQTAKELGRQANLDIQGGDTPVDRSVLERMLGPLEHLLRNAVAHGIEPAEKRQAAGKPELGQIALTIVPTDNDITLTLADDGAGLNHAAIRRRAIERGLLEPDTEADDASIAELIFRAGFSTAETVSEIAGRGIGLDVVRDEVAQLGGRVEVSGQAGQGTRFEIVLPLTLAVIPVMLVRSGERSWAIPAGMVEEVRELNSDEIVALRTAGSTSRGGRHYPWHTLAGLCGEPIPAPAETAWQILLKGGAGQITLEVESITQNQEVVVKPVGDQLAHVPGLTGATVLPDGSVALIVNPVALAQRSLAPATTRVAITATTKPVARAATVMVVDDSLTVRKITGRLLERAGYRVLTAKDGIDALEQLETTLPDVMLADIEMPRMDGFELVRCLREDTRLAKIPVIMITSRTADKHRQVAAAIGVQHYLGKPYDEAELLGLIGGLVRPTRPV